MSGARYQVPERPGHGTGKTSTGAGGDGSRCPPVTPRGRRTTLPAALDARPARAARPDESGSRPRYVLWHKRPVTQALLPVSFYRTAHGGAATRTARSGCATMAVPAMTGHGRDTDPSGQDARATFPRVTQRAEVSRAEAQRRRDRKENKGVVYSDSLRLSVSTRVCLSFHRFGRRRPDMARMAMAQQRFRRPCTARGIFLLPRGSHYPASAIGRIGWEDEFICRLHNPPI